MNNDEFSEWLVCRGIKAEWQMVGMVVMVACVAAFIALLVLRS